MGHFMCDGEGQFLAGMGKSDQAEVDREDIAAGGIGIDRGASIQQEEARLGKKLAVGVGDLPDDVGDIGIDFPVMDIVVVADAAQEGFGAAIPDLLILFL